jgi:GT2 family glycosyltransferase
VSKASSQTVLPKVGVVVVNLNRREDLLRCLRALLGSDYGQTEVLVIDNGSTDGSPEVINQQFPQVTLLCQPKNLGFTGGNNLGIKYFMERNVEYLFLLNNDAVVEKNTLSMLVKAAQDNSQAGFLGPKLLTIENPQVILSAGAYLKDGWNPIQRGIGEVDQGQYDQAGEVDFLSGNALLVNRNLVEKIGMFDESFFAYLEDAEWCIRGHNAGFDVLYIPWARAWHPDTRYRDENSASVTYYIMRNNLLLALRNHLGWRKITMILSRYILTLLSWTFRPKWKHKHKQRDILFFVLRDFILSRFGPMGSDVSRVCFGS